MLRLADSSTGRCGSCRLAVKRTPKVCPTDRSHCYRGMHTIKSLITKIISPTRTEHTVMLTRSMKRNCKQDRRLTVALKTRPLYNFGLLWHGRDHERIHRRDEVVPTLFP